MRADGKSGLKEKVRRLPDKPGVYLMKDRLGGILYVGKAKSLKKRVSTYFQRGRLRIQQPKISAMVDLIADFETIQVKSEPEALILEGRLIKQWRPRYNTDFIDDKRFLLVRMDPAAAMPRFTLTRLRKDDGARYFGPFAHSAMLRRTLAQMRRQFGILLGDSSPKQLPDGRWQLYDDVRAELYTQSNVVTTEEYLARIAAAAEFLEGKSREWLGRLREEMQQAAAAQEYEKAANLRDIVFALEKTLSPARKFSRTHVPEIPAREAMDALRDALALPALPQGIECFDISHISGTFVVASMVRFTGGRPDKANYRRFKIKGNIANDDYRAMEQVVGRRYRRLADEKKPMPELVVIDGGRGQVAAALKAFIAADLEPPALVGIAKERETIVFPDARPPLNLPLDHPGLQLLQRIRDEAHRFANSFNADLRSKRIRESVLDEFPGMGPLRRRALLAHFGSIDRLRAASAKDIAEAPGFGPLTAQALHKFLSGKSTNRIDPL
jgi:excinuclease ABC subunit C